MKKTVFAFFIISILISCKKTNTDKQYCYECNFDNSGYKAIGCMTEAQFDSITFSDNLGNPYPKTSCRKK